jgi:hypothetical protein
MTNNEQMPNGAAPSRIECLATPAEVARMLCVPVTWVYAHQRELPGLLRLGRYVRFRRTVIEQFLLRK